MFPAVASDLVTSWFVVQVIAHYFFKIDIHWFLLALLLPMIVMNWINNLKYLTPVSLFASLLTSSSLGITFFYMLQGTVALHIRTYN